MTAQPVERASATPDPGRTPAAVRAVLARHADQATLALFDRELDAAYVEALGSGSPEPMRAVVGRWWTVAQMAEHGPAADQRFVSREQFAAQWERRNGRPFPGA